MKTNPVIPTNLTATEVLVLQREHADADAMQAQMDDAWLQAFRKAHAKGLADRVDDAVMDALLPKFGEGIYDYD